MAVHPRWYVFADDAGDPHLRGSPHFGYALIAIEQSSLPRFNQARAEFRHEHQVFHEAKKGNPRSQGFQALIAQTAELVADGTLECASTFITKDRYRGPWLLERPGVPASSHFLRNYLIRHSLELLFDHAPAPPEATLELVIDRVRYSTAQVDNLRAYLNGKFNGDGRFNFPYVTDVTHADSQYVEALQVADHVARMAHQIVASRDTSPAQWGNADSFLTICTRIRGGDSTLHPEAAAVLTGVRRLN